MQRSAGGIIGAQLVNRTTGAAFAGSVIGYITGDGGTQAAATNSCVAEGNGYYSLILTTTETDFALVAVTFTGTSAIPATIQILTTPIPTLTPSAGLPVSGATAALDLITDSFYELNCFLPGESIPNADAQTGLRYLNRMLSIWKTQSFTIPAILRSVLSWTAGQGGPTNPYTIGSGGDFDIARPSNQQSIKQAMLLLVDGETEIPLGVMTDQSYDQLPVKSLAGTQPTSIYYNPTFTSGLGALYTWPVPNTTTTQLVLYCEQPLTTFGNLTTAYQLPDGYDDALMYCLALRLAGPYGKPVSDDLREFATQGLRLIKRANCKMSDMQNYFISSSWWDINSGTLFVR